jgi:hypothetical protein
MKHVLDLVHKTNLLQILGCDHMKKNLSSRDASFLYTIQSLLAPSLLSFDDWHSLRQTGFQDAQVFAYDHNEARPIFTGPQGLNIDMQWLLRNFQFWRNHFLVANEPLSPAFSQLQAHERPQFWDSQLSQDSHNIGAHWKGSYAFVNRNEINAIRAGTSGQGSVPNIQDQLNGEDDPYEHAFQNVFLALSDPDPSTQNPWRHDFEHILQSLSSRPDTARTRAQHKQHSRAAVRDFKNKALRIEGDGTDNEEDFYMDGWLNPLPMQHGVPGWMRVTMMKYFVEEGEHEEEIIDTEALWAYEGVMMPGGKIVVGRWWCPTDGNGARMYSGPFILWNVESPEMDADEGCAPGEHVGDSSFGASCLQKK